MKKEILAITLFLFSLKGFCQENNSFPLDIGNKFFYTAGRNPDDGYYGAKKTIIDSLDNGVRAVLVEKYINNSTSESLEYWWYDNNKFYISNSSSNMGIPVFDSSNLNDTCYSYTLSSFCYTILDSVIYSINRYCQKFVYNWHTHIDAGSSKVFTANGIGLFSYWKSYFISGTTTIDSIVLLGYIDGGNMIGDTVLTDIGEPNNSMVNSFQLYQNYPNPFNPVTTIKIEIPKSSFVNLKVYDLLGREVATLVNEEKPAGSYEVDFNGNSLSSGIYFYKLQTESYTEVKKMILLK